MSEVASQAQTAVEALEQQVAQVLESFQERDRELAEREREATKRQIELSVRDTALGAREKKLEEREQETAQRETQLGEREHALGTREAEITSRAAELESREQEIERRTKGVVARELLVSKVERPTGSTAPASRGVNLERLDRLVAEQRDRFPDRAAEWDAYLFYLRDQAGSDGTLPPSLTGLVEEVFAPIL